MGGALRRPLRDVELVEPFLRSRTSISADPDPEEARDICLVPKTPSRRKSSHEDILLNIIDGYFSREGAENEAEMGSDSTDSDSDDDDDDEEEDEEEDEEQQRLPVVQRGSVYRRFSDSTDQVAFLRDTFADTGSQSWGPFNFTKSRSFDYDMPGMESNNGFPNLKPCLSPRDRHQRRSSMKRVTIMIAEQHVKELWRVHRERTAEEQKAKSTEEDYSDQEASQAGALSLEQRRELFEQAKQSPGKDSAEKLHQELHPRYWGITRAQLSWFDSRLQEAVHLGQVFNTSLPGSTAAEYSQEQFEKDGPNMRQVIAMFIRPRTNETAPILPYASYALQCNDKEGKECELFASHAWDQGVFDFVTSLLSVWPHRCAGAYISALCNPQNLSSYEDLKGNVLDAPFFRVLAARPRLMLMVVNEVTPIHSRLWCTFEAYSAHFLGVPIEIVGNPIYLVVKEKRCMMEDALIDAVNSKLQEVMRVRAASDDLRHDSQLFRFGAEEAAAQALRRAVQTAAPSVTEARCFSLRDRAVITAELSDGMAAIDIFVIQQLLKRFAQECQSQVYNRLDRTLDAMEDPAPLEVAKNGSITRPIRGIQQRLAEFKEKREAEKQNEMLTILSSGVLLISIGAAIQSTAGIATIWASHREANQDNNASPATSVVLDNVLRGVTTLGVLLCVGGFLVMFSCRKVDFDDIVGAYPLVSAGLFAASAILSAIKANLIAGNEPVYMCVVPALLGVIRCQCPRMGFCPFATTCMASYWLLETVASGYRNFLADDPDDDASRTFKHMKVLGNLMSSVLQASCYIIERCWARHTMGTTPGPLSKASSAWCSSENWKHGATQAAYHLLYIHLLLTAADKILELLLKPQGPQDQNSSNKQQADPVLMGFFQWIETLALLLPLVGRDSLFRCFELHFESKKDRRERDGAFIAEMLGSVQIELGQQWWIHLEDYEKNFLFADNCHKHHFVQGKVVEVNDDSFSVRIPKDPKPRTLPLAGRNLSQDELVRLGRQQLRCIEWHKVSRKLFCGGNAGGRQEVLEDTFSLSRPVRPGERIDYFLSHSWHDDGDDKYNLLQSLVATFRQKHGRYPTFWLDIVCISQDNIGDGLAVLPVNVMACHRILALAGSTYPKRLWCGVELATLFSFMPAQQAIRRVQLEPVGNRREQVLTALTHFKVSDAHCYDPNEEEKILRVIEAVSADHFENNIRMLAERLVEDMNKSTNMVDIVARENELRRQNEELVREGERLKSERETALQLLDETKEEVRKLKLENERLRSQRTELLANVSKPIVRDEPPTEQQQENPQGPVRTESFTLPCNGIPDRASSFSSFLAEADKDLQQGDLLTDLPTRPSRAAKQRFLPP